jgi:glycosyltransferase involved in cell wall biosynthesis
VWRRPNEELDFARQIAALLADAGLRQKIGRAGRARVEANLAWAQQAKALVEAYGRLTGRPSNGLNTNLGVADQ